MPTLENLFKLKRNGPYVPPVTVKVCGVSAEKQYVNQSGEEKRLVYVGVVDSTMAVKCTVYDREKLRNMAVGTTVMLMNMIVKPDNSITITSKSRVCKTGPVSVSAELERAALELAVPPTSPESPLIDVEKSPVKTMMSIRGQVVAEEMTRTVLVRGRDVKVKALVLKDQSAKCKVSLWRDLSSTPVSVGQHVRITDVVVQSYNNDKLLSTTSRTQIEAIDTPAEQDLITKIIAFTLEEDYLVIVLDDGEIYPSHNISRNLMMDFLECSAIEVEGALTRRLPLHVKITIENEEIVSLQ